MTTRTLRRGRDFSGNDATTASVGLEEVVRAAPQKFRKFAEKLARAGVQTANSYRKMSCCIRALNEEHYDRPRSIETMMERITCAEFFPPSPDPPSGKLFPSRVVVFTMKITQFV